MKYPLSQNQKGILMADLNNTGEGNYNCTWLFRLDQDVDIPRLKKALEKAGQVHPMIKARLCFDEAGNPSFESHEDDPVIIGDFDFENEEALLDHVRKEPEIQGNPLYRLEICRTPGRNYLLTDFHHLITDGSSMQIYFADVSDAYSGKEPAAEKISGFALALEEAEARNTPGYEEDRQYFLSEFSGASDCTSMPLPDRYGDSDYRFSAYTKVLDFDRKALAGLCEKIHTTEGRVFTAAYGLTLGKYTGSDEVLFSTVFNGRNDSRVDRTFAMLVRTMPVYQKLSGTETVSDLVLQVGSQLSQTRKHKLFSYFETVSELGLNVESYFAYHGSVRDFVLHLDGKPQYSVDFTTNSPGIRFVCHIKSENGNYVIKCEYPANLFSEEFIEGFCDTYQTVFSEMLMKEKLRDVEVCAGSQLEKVKSFHSFHCAETEETVVSMFRSAAKQYPDNTAIVFRDKRYTYRKLDEITDLLSGYIAEVVGKKEKQGVVSILIPRNEYMAILPMSVQKAGCCYQPLDPGYPSERLNFMVRDAEASLVIADPSLADMLSDYSGKMMLTTEVEEILREGRPLPLPEPAKHDDAFILLYTSGSTGTPKGVILEQRNIAAYCRWYREYYDYVPGDNLAGYASFGFDMHICEIYGALTSGYTCHIIPEEIRLDLLQLNQYFQENNIVGTTITTAVGVQFAAAIGSTSLRNMMTGGEKLVSLEPPGNYQLINAYGPTECTLHVTEKKVCEKEEVIPIGRPLSIARCYIVDQFMHRLPAGAAGEMIIAGPQVARGYLNRPDKTAEVFIKDPFVTEGSEYFRRAYKTGDIVRWRQNGDIEFVGRKDSQVKIHGYRIELREVEAVIREFPGIKDVTVQAFAARSGEKYLVAYIVAGSLSEEELRKFVAAKKPAYMVPEIIMKIDRIPLNVNQKVDVKALPAPERKAGERVMPKSDRQQEIYDALKKVLSQEDFGITTPFPEAGLNSISSIRLIVELTQRLGVPVTIKDLKEHDTIETLEKHLAYSYDAEIHAERSKYPLTKTQLGIYVEYLRHPDSIQYNIPGAFALRADTDTERVKKAIHKVIDAHPAVKCVIRGDEAGDIFMVPKPDEDFEIKVEEGTEEEWKEFFAHYAHPFDLGSELLFRFTLYKTGENLYVAMDFHHIVCDGSSIAVLIEELNRVLSGREPEGEILSQYDAAVSEEKMRGGQDYTRAKEFYDSVYDGNSARYGLDGDLKEEKEGCGVWSTLDARVSRAQVKAFCNAHRITENVFLTSVMGYVMGQYNRTEDAIFTTIYHGRKDSRMMNTVGMFVKTLPVYSRFPKDMTVADYTEEMQSRLMDSMQHDIYSFAEISNAYKIKPEIMFVYQGDSFSEFEVDGQKTTLHSTALDKAKANISLDIYAENDGYRYDFEYRSDLYSGKYIEHFCDIYVTAAESFLTAEKIGDVSVLSEKEAARIAGFNATEYDVELQSVNRLFEAWVRKIPDQIAVIASGETLTYRELNEKANTVANGLIKRGSAMNTLVGLILEREKNVYIVRQGILKAGAGFLPLVPDYPDDRIDFCLRDGQCRFVITTETIREERKELFDGKPYEVLTVEELLGDSTVSRKNPDLDIPVSNIAYCLYTSGSTGRPKGVLIEHGTLCNFVNSNPKNIEVENYTKNGKMSLAFAAITFDVSVMEEYIPLTNGMTVCMANDDEVHNPLLLAQLLLRHHVEIMKCTPSYMMNIVDIPEMQKALKQIRAFDIGAEAFPPVLYDKMRAVNPTADIINSYGPTECTVSATSKLLRDSGNVNIGGPLANMKLYVVNSSNRSLPTGLSGELIICGAGVGRGYMNLPDKTKEAFFTYKGMPAYHSGDLVKWNDDGEIVCLGRMDNQVKLHGLRIELDEVERVMESFHGVKSCKAIIQTCGNDEYLAAYYTAGTAIDQKKLVEYLSSKLSRYMVPGALMQLEEMPLNNNGKIDRSRLPEIHSAIDAREYEAPKNALEKELCEKFREVLGLERVGATDSFFEIGGTSLSAAKIVMYCSSMGYPIVYKDIFANPSPRQLARLIAGTSDVPERKAKASGFDYAAIDEILGKNVFAADMKIRSKKVNGILLTGATGFLGIHILRELLAGDFGKIYCLVRKGRFKSCESRVKSIYAYYFSREFSQEEWNRIECVNADLTDSDLKEIFAVHRFDVIINCAACVKHFVKDDILDRINVKGVENLIDLALSKDAELIQISTVSVAGQGDEDTVPDTKQMLENELFFGQILENDYIRTKFLAERAVLSAAAKDGLRAKIMRCGNLMSRKSDGEFQINFVTNAFMRSLRGYRVLGKFPMGMMHSPAEFSPVDSTAKAIVTLMQCAEDYTVFHTYNSHKVYMSDVICSMRDFGFDIDIVSDEEFSEALRKAEKDESLSSAVLGLIAYNDSEDKPRYQIGMDNRFTSEVLYRMNYKWPITDDEYLRKAIEALNGFAFFE